MMILRMDSHLEELQNFREILLRLNGQDEIRETVLREIEWSPSQNRTDQSGCGF